MDDRLYTGVGTGGPIPCGIFFKCCQRLQDRLEVSVFIIVFEVSQILPLCRASRAVPSYATGDKHLLRVIPDETSENGECSMHNPITSGHLDGASSIQGFQWCKHAGEAVMEKVSEHSTTRSCARDMKKRSRGEIA